MQYPWLFGSFMPSVIAGVTGVRGIIRVGAGEPVLDAVSAPVAPAVSAPVPVAPAAAAGEAAAPAVPTVVVPVAPAASGTEAVAPAPATTAEPSITAAAAAAPATTTTDASAAPATAAATTTAAAAVTGATATKAPTTTTASALLTSSTSTPSTTTPSTSTPSSTPSIYHPVALDTTPSGGLVEAGETPHPASKKGTKLPPWPRPRAKGGIETVAFVGGGYGGWIGRRNGVLGGLVGGKGEGGERERVMVCEGGVCREEEVGEGVW